MGRCKKDVCVNSTVISDADEPAVLEAKVTKLMVTLVDAIGADVFKRAVSRALNKSSKCESTELSPEEAYTLLVGQVAELDEHLEELDGYVAEWMGNIMPSDVEELNSRLARIEQFLSENCPRFDDFEADEEEEEDEEEDEDE